MKIKKGDTVKVITGKEKGKTGKVNRVFRESERVVVEGVNIAKRHRKATSQNTKSGIIEFESPIAISNVMLIDSKTGKTSRVGFKFENNKKIRVAKKSGEKI